MKNTHYTPIQVYSNTPICKLYANCNYLYTYPFKFIHISNITVSTFMIHNISILYIHILIGSICAHNEKLLNVIKNPFEVILIFNWKVVV